ncbi:hypothetical protein C8J56DRAFT_963659 [Mycena floridula]|nr:hypothetical protein C8J56DRAFT_963659 [Mycena floridula]
MSTLPEGFPPVVTLQFFGNIFNFWLFGILTVQAYYYYINFGKTDLKRIRFVALLTIVLEFVQTVLVISDGYILFCERWGDPAVLLRAGLAWVYVPVLGGLMSFVAQLFWAWRLSMLTKIIWIPIAIITLSITQFVAALVGGISGRNITDVTKLVLEFKPLTVWIVSVATADVIIVASMLYFYSTNRSSFAGTKVVLSKILFITIETGMCCATIAVLDLVLFLVFANQNWHLCTAITLSKFYANSLLVVLNSRTGGRYSNSDTEAYQVHSLQSQQKTDTRHGGINIQVTRDPRADEPIPMVHMLSTPGTAQEKSDDSYVKF